MLHYFTRARYVPYTGVILRMHRYGMRLAFASAHVFSWLFVFQISYAITTSVADALLHTALLYTLSQIVVYIMTPYVALELRHGVRQLMLAGVLMAVSAFALLIGAIHVLFAGALAPWTLIGFALVIGMYRAFYWIPYHAEIDFFHPHSKVQHFFYETSIALAPFFAGFFLVAHAAAPIVLLYVASAICALSAIPILFMPEKYESFQWSYREALEAVYDTRYRSIVWQMVANGFQGAIMLVFWPLAIFLMTGWSYFVVGGIVSVTLLLFPLVRGLYHRVLKKWQLEHSMPVQVFVVVSAWIMRAAVGSPIGVIVVDTFARGGIEHAHIDSATFEQIADGGLFIDKYSVLKELSLAVGKIAASITMVVALVFMTVPQAFVTLFILAGGAAALAVVLAARSGKHPF